MWMEIYVGGNDDHYYTENARKTLESSLITNIRATDKN